MNEEITNLEKQYQDKVKELVELEKKLVSAIDKAYESNEDYVKIECPHCKGEGRYKDKDNKLKVCNICMNGRGWIFAKKYVQEQ